MQKAFVVFIAVFLIAVFILLLVSVEARLGQGCQCHFIGECTYDENGVGYKYYYCGNCNAYSGWRQHSGCYVPDASKPLWPHS